VIEKYRERRISKDLTIKKLFSWVNSAKLSIEKISCLLINSAKIRV